jgi:hypothetical protein
MARDVMLVFHGSIALVTPLTEPATIWVRQHLEHWGPIVAGMADDGLVIQAE